MSRVDVSRSVGTVGGTAMLIRREAFERVGCFDEDFFMYSEEADLAKRLERASLERHFVPTVEVLHHRLQSTVTMPERRINEVWRSLELYLAKHHGRLEGRILRWLTGLGYALAIVPAEIGRHLPERLQPPRSGSWDSRAHRLHVRNAFRGTQGPGIRELAEEWNRAHGRRPASGPPRAEAPPAHADDRSRG
jgi:GT2 family glycosyltransferase